MTLTKRTTFHLLAALILLAGFALRVISLGDDSLWSDETFTVFFAEAPAGDFLDLLLADGVHVPLYFTVMRFLPTGNDFLLRMPSLAFGMAGIALLMGVVRRLYRDDSLALWAGALLAFNPYHIWFSRMARPYTLFFIMALLTSYVFLLLLRGDRSTRNWIAFGLLTAASYMTHFFAAALPLAQYAVFAFVLSRNRRMLRQWLLVQIVAFIPLAWWIYRLGTQEVVSFGIAWIPDPTLLDPFITLANMGTGYDGTLILYFIPALIAFAAGLLPGIRRAWRERRRGRADLYWLWLILVALVPVTLISRVRPIYADRYFIVCLPALLLLTLRGWETLQNGRWRIALASIVMLTGVLHIGLLIAREDNERQSWHAAADLLADQYQPGDVFVMDTALSLLPLLRYWDDEALFRAHIVAPADAPDSDAARLWTIIPDWKINIHRQGNMGDFDPFEPREAAITDWAIAQRDHITARYDFNGISVLLMEPERE